MQSISTIQSSFMGEWEFKAIFSSNKTPWKIRERAPPADTIPARRRCRREGNTAHAPVWSPR